MLYVLIAFAAFNGTMIAIILWQTVTKKGQLEMIEEASRTAAAYMLVQIRAEFKTHDGTSLRDAVDRIERTSERAEAATVVVAEDLAASHDRADSAHGVAGEAADAASRSPDA